MDTNSGPQLERLQHNREDEADADVVHSVPQQGRRGGGGLQAAEPHQNLGCRQHQQGSQVAVTEQGKLRQQGNPQLAEKKAAGEAENQDHPAPPWGLQQVEKPATHTGGSTLKTGVL